VVDGDVVVLDTTLDQQFLDVAVGQVVAQMPPNRQHEHLGRDPESEGRLRLRNGRRRRDDSVTDQPCPRSAGPGAKPGPRVLRGPGEWLVGQA